MMGKYLPLQILLLVFLAPALGAAYLLNFSDRASFHQVEHGTIVEPQHYHDRNIVVGKWNVLYTSDKNSEVFTNLHKALGKDRDRVAFAGASIESGAMIVNPHGMQVMHYPLPVDMSGLLKDLKRLLKYSHAN